MFRQFSEWFPSIIIVFYKAVTKGSSVKRKVAVGIDRLPESRNRCFCNGSNYIDLEGVVEKELQTQRHSG